MRELTIGGYVVFAIAAVALVAAGWSGRLAPVGEVLELLRGRWTGRLFLVAAWAWFGWHLLVRTG